MKMRNESGLVARIGNGRLAALAGAAFLTSIAGAADFIGPTSYSQAGDGPLPLGGIGPIVVHTFESKEPPVGMQILGATTRMLGNSVDADDEILDGDGSTGHSLELLGAAMFLPDVDALGGAPTRFGVVVTDSIPDGGGVASLSVGGGEPLAFVRITVIDVNNQQSTYDFPAASLANNAGDDLFIGVVVPEGIASVNVSSSFPTVKIDHLQYDSAAALPQQFNRDDFDGDRRSDIAWYRSPGQKCAIWNVIGTAVSGAYTSIAPPSSTARIVGTGDADANGRADILWYDPSNGRYSIWFMSGFAASATLIDRYVSEAWVPAAYIDIDGDLIADVVFRRTEGGQTKIAVWLMAADATIRQGQLTVLDGAYDELFVGFLNGDNLAEAMLRKTAAGPDQGAIYIASFSGAALGTPSRILALGGAVEPAVDIGYKIAGLADTDADGDDDVIWRSPTGGVERWEMRALRVESKAVVWANTTNYWSIAAFPDFDADGKRGIFFRGLNGETWRWELDGDTITASDPLNTVILPWKVTSMQH